VLLHNRSLPRRRTQHRPLTHLCCHSDRHLRSTLIDDDGLSARMGADHLGHSRISMTQDRYMARGRVHTAVADLLDRTVGDTDTASTESD
jgi:integrase